MRDHTDLMQQKAEVGSIDTKTIEFCKSDSCNAGSSEVFVVAICSVQIWMLSALHSNLVGSHTGHCF